LPPNSFGNAVSTILEPNPRRSGGRTAGPPDAARNDCSTVSRLALGVHVLDVIFGADHADAVLARG
jgi:hypothetical protein